MRNKIVFEEMEDYVLNQTSWYEQLRRSPCLPASGIGRECGNELRLWSPFGNHAKHIFSTTSYSISPSLHPCEDRKFRYANTNGIPGPGSGWWAGLSYGYSEPSALRLQPERTSERAPSCPYRGVPLILTLYRFLLQHILEI